MLCVANIECHYAQCRYGECRYADFRYDKRRGACLTLTPRTSILPLTQLRSSRIFVT
jgi:hypothetical protein